MRAIFIHNIHFGEVIIWKDQLILGVFDGGLVFLITHFSLNHDIFLSRK